LLELLQVFKLFEVTENNIKVQTSTKDHNIYFILVAMHALHQDRKWLVLLASETTQIRGVTA